MFQPSRSPLRNVGDTILDFIAIYLSNVNDEIQVQ